GVGPAAERPIVRETAFVAPTPGPVQAHPEAIDLVDPIRSLDPAPSLVVVTAAEREAAADPSRADLDGDAADRVTMVHFGATEPVRINALVQPFEGTGSANIVAAFTDHLDGGGQSALIWDTFSKTVLGAVDLPTLGAGDDDVLELEGDFSAGFELPGMAFGLDAVVAHAGSDYNLVANDNNVDAGDTLTINGMPLGADNHVMFDGSAETDGRFEFLGSAGDDFFFGGGGGDRILGLGGADTLSGGGGSDIFVYSSARESSGADYDTIADFDPAADRINLPGAIASFGDAIEGGSLSTATFNEDLAAALADLGAAQAVWFAPDAGDLAGQIFLIVDGNDQAGYQPGEDFVFAIGGAPLEDLTGHTEIFI
ncbi:MAG TPA: hypothetical protein VJS15_01605, partial [Allosphingosinicella sp.]|nr:hypothetical protein [Allosphingosinicella sp.]